MGKYNKKKEIKRPAAPIKAQKQHGSSDKYYYIFLFFFAFLLYANTLKHEYAFDDAAAIVNNAYTQAGIKGIPDLLTKDFFQAFSGHESNLGGRWRPLSLITFAIEYQLFGANPHVNHWMNVIFYGLTAIFLFLMLQKVCPGKKMVNFLVTLLFIAHPTHTEVVANIKSCDEILSLLGLCITVYLFFKFIESGKSKFIIGSCIAYFLALTSKENGITFLAIIPLMLVCFAGKTWKESILKMIPLFVVAAIYVVIRWKMVGMIGDTENHEIMSNPFEGATAGQKYATIFKVLGKYLWLVLFPVKLAYDYSYNEIPRVGWDNIWAIVSLLIILSLLVFSVITVFKPRAANSRSVPLSRVIAFGILFYFITISIVSNLVFNVGAPMADRFLYLPSLGFCLVVAWSLFTFLKADVVQAKSLSIMDFIKSNSKLVVISCILLALYSFKTIDRNPVWKNNRTLYESGVYDAPGDALNHHRFANQLLSVDAAAEKDSLKRDAIYNRSIDELNKAIAIVPENFNAYTDMGALYENKNDMAGALKCYDLALKYNPNSIRTLSNKGVVLAKIGRYGEALEIFRQAINIDSTYSSGLSNFGLCSFVLKNYDDAIHYMDKANVYEKEVPKKIYNARIMAQAFEAKGEKSKSDSCLAIASRLEAESKN